MSDEFPSELAHKIERLLWIVNSFRGQFIMYSTDLYGITECYTDYVLSRYLFVKNMRVRDSNIQTSSLTKFTQ